MLGIGRFLGRAAAAIVVVVISFLCRNGLPKKRTPKSKIKSRIISLGGVSLPRETILDSVIESSGLAQLAQLPRLRATLSNFACLLVLFALLALLALLACLACLLGLLALFSECI